MQQRQLVEHVGQPLAFRLPVDMQSPQGVLQRLGAHGNLRCQGLLTQMLQGTANLEILGEVVLPIEAEHALALHAVVVVGLQRDVDAGTSIDDALIEDGHLTSRVVDGIVAALGQPYATSGNDHRALRHIGGTKRDNVSRRTLELTHQQELVLVSHLHSGSTGGVVELVEGILRSGLSVDATTNQEVLQRGTERLYRWEEHTAVADSVALDIVKVAVGVCLEIVVQTVAAQAAQQGGLLGLRLWDIADIDARGIALVLDVEAELLLLDISSQIVDVLHHQRPVELLRIVGRILQRLDIERLLGSGMVSGKLTDMVGLAIVGILVGYRQHLVALQRGLQRDIA